ncbi:hypothetical protein ZWY2020_040564 [Hordeum vulgare]|nr:hypothetical protein ZWY2020_040564 [Hordeum vulgare]
MQLTSKKAVEAMEHLLPHEIVERELEMQEAAEIEECQEEELRMAEDEVEKSISIEESAVEYQRKLSCSHYYEYYNLEGGVEDEDDDDGVVDFSRGEALFTNGDMLPGEFINISSYTGEA